MKTIIFISLAIIMGCYTVSASSINAFNNKNSVTLACENCAAGDNMILQSAEILKNRLNSFGIENYKVKISESDPSIKISFPNKEDLKRSMEILTSRGNIGFYEVLEGNESGTGDYQMSMLKGDPAIAGSYIQESSVKPADNGKNADVLITFTEEGGKLWSDLTKRNINKPIAIVIDNEVCFAPTVKFEIKHGKCRMSGNFSADEANSLVAIINNGELPVDLKLIE